MLVLRHLRVNLNYFDSKKSKVKIPNEIDDEFLKEKEKEILRDIYALNKDKVNPLSLKSLKVKHINRELLKDYNFIKELDVCVNNQQKKIYRGEENLGCEIKGKCDKSGQFIIDDNVKENDNMKNKNKNNDNENDYNINDCNNNTNNDNHNNNHNCYYIYCLNYYRKIHY